MGHFHDIDSMRLESCELTIGSFDGIHIGHKSLLNQMVARAREKSIPSVLLTFFPHPSVVLRGRRPSFYINTPEEKAEQLFALGVDHVVAQRFDRELSKIKARDFLEWIHTHLQFQGLWVGENFALGYQREGNVAYLEKIRADWNFELHIIPPVYEGGEIVSSTRVRDALRSGDVARVATYLGRHFLLPGVVAKGSGRGKKLGIPTANLAIWEERAYPGSGVYASKVHYEGEKYDAVTNIGIRPTFNDDLEHPIVETHILEFDQDLYEKTIQISFIDRLRDERKFSGPEELLLQIDRDIQKAISILNNVGEGT